MICLLAQDESYGHDALDNIYSLRRNRIKMLKPAIDRQTGYIKVELLHDWKVKYRSVHRLIAINSVGGYQPGLDVNHIDGCKTNNHPENLEWVTRSENIRHAFRLGLSRAPADGGSR